MMPGTVKLAHWRAMVEDMARALQRVAVLAFALAVASCGASGGPDIGKLNERAASGDSKAFDQLLGILDKQDPESSSYGLAKIGVDESAIKHLSVLEEGAWGQVGEPALRRFDLFAAKSPRGENRARVIADFLLKHQDKKVVALAADQIATMNGIEAWTVARVAVDASRLDDAILDCLVRLTTLGGELQGTPVTAVVDATVQLLGKSNKGDAIRDKVANIIGRFGDRAHVEGAYAYLSATERRTMVGQLAEARNLSHLSGLVDQPKLSAVEALQRPLLALDAATQRKDANAARDALDAAADALWSLQLGYKVHLCFAPDKAVRGTRAIAGLLTRIAKFTIAQLLELVPDRKDTLSRVELDCLVLAKAVETPATCS